MYTLIIIILADALSFDNSYISPECEVTRHGHHGDDNTSWDAEMHHVGQHQEQRAYDEVNEGGG